MRLGVQPMKEKINRYGVEKKKKDLRVWLIFRILTARNR